MRAGKLRAVALTGATRSSTAGEFIPGFETILWFGVGAPAGTAGDVADKLNKSQREPSRS